MPIWSQCLFKITPLTLLLLSFSLIFNLLTGTFPSDFLSSLAELPTLMIWLQFLLSSSQTNIPTLPTSALDLPYRVSYQWSPTWISQLHCILSAHSQGVKTALSSPSQTEILVRFWFTLFANHNTQETHMDNIHVQDGAGTTSWDRDKMQGRCERRMG